MCRLGFAGENCSFTCSLHGCNGHGRCRGTGICECAQGYARTKHGTCAACPAGTYSNATGMAECLTCPSGSSSAAASIAQTDCTCDSGYTGPDGGQCSACVAGTYKEVEGSHACTLCAKGKYSTEMGEVSEATCTGCPPNTDSLLGSNNITNCSCNGGYTGPDGMACSPCLSGTYKAVNGSGHCLPCSDGTIASKLASTCILESSVGITSTPILVHTSALPLSPLPGCA